jgi:hypothetical protein
MSNHAAKPGEHRKKRETATTRIDLALSAFAIVSLLILGMWQLHSGGDRSEWPSATAQILDTRIAVVGITDSASRGSLIHYRAEAEVIYELGNTRHDAWVPASEVFISREELQFWLFLKDPKNCIVRWNPKNPDDIEAVLQPRIKS